MTNLRVSRCMLLASAAVPMLLGAEAAFAQTTAQPGAPTASAQSTTNEAPHSC